MQILSGFHWMVVNMRCNKARSMVQKHNISGAAPEKHNTVTTFRQLHHSSLSGPAVPRAVREVTTEREMLLPIDSDHG